MYFEQNMIDITLGREPANTSLQNSSVAFVGESASSGYMTYIRPSRQCANFPFFIDNLYNYSVCGVT